MNRARIRQIVRQFMENGLKLLLHHPANVRELLQVLHYPHLDLLDFSRMTVDPTTYINPDYRHLESDLLLQLPLRGRARRRTLVYLLVEHQFAPDRLMIFRLLQYLVAIWQEQLRRWEKEHPSPAGAALQPILPIVLYTGQRAWPTLGTLTDLMERGEQFVSVTPMFQPLFASLPLLTAPELHAGGAFGRILELLQHRRDPDVSFRTVLEQVVGHLETLPSVERARWLELLSYIEALVYHEREPTEQEQLRDVIVASARTNQQRRDLDMARRTIADELIEKGEKRGEIKGWQASLLFQLEHKFGTLPEETRKLIKRTRDESRLKGWTERAMTVQTLDEMGLTPDS